MSTVGADTPVPRSVDAWLQLSLLDLFGEALAHSGAREAVVDPPNRAELCGDAPQRLSYADLDRLSDRLAAALHRHGLQPGEVVLAQLPNIVELIALYLAVAKLGAVISPVAMQYRRHELAGIAAAAQPKLSVVVGSFKNTCPADEHRAALPADTPILSLGGAPVAGISNLAAAAGDADAPRHAPRPDDLYTVCWTSGTTGTPKGVPRRHRQWLVFVPLFEDAIGLPRHAALLCPFPVVNMAAIGGFLVYWLALHGKLVLHHPLELPVFLKQIQDERAAYTVAPPALLNMLLGKPELLRAFDLSSLKVIGSGSAPLSPWMVEGYKRELGIDVINMFGSNEGASLLADAQDVPNPAERAIYFPRVGRPEFQWRGRLASRMQTKLAELDSGQEVTAAGRPGELLIKGPTVFDGYLNSEAERAQTFDSEGYFRTGDLFEIAGERGQFYRFVGRCKDIIIRGGLKISPEELDLILISHPDIADVATVGYPDETLGEKVCAVVVSKPGKTVTLASVTQFLEQAGVALFKHPEKLIVREQLPRNALGKVLRRQLARELTS